MNKAIYSTLATVLVAVLNIFASTAWALGYDGPGPERVAIIDQMNRIWVDDHKSLGNWRDVTGDLHKLTNAPATIVSLTISSDRLWVIKPGGRYFTCTRPCTGEGWGMVDLPPVQALSSYGSQLYSVENGWVLWRNWSNRNVNRVGAVSENVRSISGGSKQLHVLEWVGSGSKITTFERDSKGSFSMVKRNYIKLPAGQVVKISSAGDEFVGLVNNELWLFDHAQQSFNLITRTRPHDFSVGSRWLWRIGANNQVSNGILTKTLFPCLPTACREIAVPLPPNVIPDRVEAY